MPGRREYVLSAPVTHTQVDRAEVLSVKVDPISGVEVVLQYRLGSAVRATATMLFPLTAFDAFVVAAAGLPGTTFFEKILRFFASNGTLPAGGTVQEPT
jgi:hypothetical protein